MLTFEQYKDTRDMLQMKIDEVSAELHKFPRGMMGLVPDDVRVSDEYREKKIRYQSLFNSLRDLNGKYVKIYKKELAAERSSRMRELKSNAKTMTVSV